MKNEKDKKEIIIDKLKQIVTSGHIPSRFHKNYDFNSAFISNCFIHACFNLTDEQLQYFDENKLCEIKKHINHYSTDEEIKESLFSVVKATGLKIVRTNENHPCNNNQWIVAFYLGAIRYSLELGVRPVYEDYHFMLKERDGGWSEKCGTLSEINITENPPISYESNGNVYILQGYYLITNPYAEFKNNKTINEQSEEITL